MKETETLARIDRRSVLKFTGIGILGGIFGKIITPLTAHATPVLAHASWIHGHSMQVEFPDRLSSERRTGNSIIIEGKPGSINIFHFAIPTPVIVKGHRLKVGSVMLRFKTQSADALVNHLYVFDGEKRIAAHENINLSGKNMFKRFDVPGHPEVKWGLGVSLNVGFGVESLSHQMEFISAGCDFLS